MKVLILGDLVGEEGLNFLESKIQILRNEYKFNLLIINGENTTDGNGLCYNHYKRLKKMNVAAITMGNHTFRNKSIHTFINESNIVRPLNIDLEDGNGFLKIKYNDKTIMIINLLGQFAMATNVNITNPFTAVDELLKKERADYILVDFHAESTSEKYAMGYFLDGLVDLVYGTHTHVQTADEQLLEKKTLYITDIGMTGPSNGVLGIDKDIIVNRFVYNQDQKFKVSKSNCMINGIFVDLNQKTIKRVNLK